MLAIIFNAIGIILEISGFVVLLIAIKSMPREKSSFTSGFQHLPNVLSMTSSKTNKIGIGLVIAGLGFQLIALFFD